MENQNSRGHLCAFFSILVWGTTFISTKVLLRDFNPIEILLYRFAIGFLILLFLYPRRMKFRTAKQEITFALAGLCGVCMYYLLENIALTYTMASNVGVIISAAPFFTAMLSQIVMKKEEKLHINFFIGFFVAMVGICLISFNGSRLQLNPLGDFLSILAALVWACYSILIKRISSFGYHTVQTTRRVFAYGILFMIPSVYFFEFKIDMALLQKPINLLNIAFLGIGASALCFVTWNYAVKLLGAIRTSIYIYMVPVITIVTSVIILREQVTPVAMLGAILTLVGLLISENKGVWKPLNKNNIWNWKKL